MGHVPEVWWYNVFLHSLPTQKLPASSFDIEWIYLNSFRSSGAFLSRVVARGTCPKQSLGWATRGPPQKRRATYMGGSSLIELVSLVSFLQGTTRKTGEKQTNQKNMRVSGPALKRHASQPSATRAHRWHRLSAPRPAARGPKPSAQGQASRHCSELDLHGA